MSTRASSGKQAAGLTPVSETYGFGRAAQAAAEEATADGFGTIKGALAAERVAEVRIETENGAAVDRTPESLSAADAAQSPTAEAQSEDEPAMDDTAASEAASEPGVLSAADRDALIAHIAGGLPEAVRELVGGGTVQEILGSAQRAQAVHDRVATALGARAPVSAGGTARATVAPDLLRLSPVQKIAHGVREARAGR